MKGDVADDRCAYTATAGCGQHDVIAAYQCVLRVLGAAAGEPNSQAKGRCDQEDKKCEAIHAPRLESAAKETKATCREQQSPNNVRCGVVPGRLRDECRFEVEYSIGIEDDRQTDRAA